METKQWTFIDKSTWGPGPWLTEPDKAQWQDKKTGLPCLAVRHPQNGHWCGYVGVSPGHPYYEKEYDNCNVNVNVHGGLTFSNKCQETAEEDHGICHIAGPGEEEHVWWLGFDCAHSGDLSPGNNAYRAKLRLQHPGLFNDDYDTYRTLRYIKKQCQELAAQLKGIT